MPVRVVLDANVLISALLSKGTPSRLYEAFKEGSFELICSKELLSEVTEVLLRPEFGVPPEEIKALFRLLKERTMVIRPSTRIRACRDPKDDFILECAIAGRARWIVTGDKDLLVLDPFRGIRIVPPADFLKHLK